MLTGIEADGWEIASDYRPARSIGGDFFDVFPLLDPDRPRHLGVVIADVSGKGISAALLMAFVRPIIRTALDRTGDPVAALERTNKILVEERPTGLFVTVLAGVLDLDTGRFTFANAGHEPPLVARPDGTPVQAFEAAGPLVGAFRELGLAETTIDLEPGDRLVLYTDGITDAVTADRERYGEDRFRRSVAAASRGTAGETARALIDDVLEHQAAADPADDLALLIFRRLPAG
jgi:sigma-B regulation protein RsbU (phosphoserine phosphatase)